MQELTSHQLGPHTRLRVAVDGGGEHFTVYVMVQASTEYNFKEELALVRFAVCDNGKGYVAAVTRYVDPLPESNSVIEFIPNWKNKEEECKT